MCVSTRASNGQLEGIGACRIESTSRNEQTKGRVGGVDRLWCADCLLSIDREVTV